MVAPSASDKNIQPDRTIRTYDRIAPQFSLAHFHPDFWIPEFRAFQKFVPGKTVVDIGCGAGRDAALFGKARFNYTGIDASRGMLAVARKRVKRGKFILMNFYNLRFPEQSFDGFWAAASLLHIPKRRLDKTLRSIRGILKPHGVGFISVKEKVSLDEGLVREKSGEASSATLLSTRTGNLPLRSGKTVFALSKVTPGEKTIRYRTIGSVIS